MFSNLEKIKSDLLMSLQVCVSFFSRFMDFLDFLTCYVGFDVAFSILDVWNMLCSLSTKWGYYAYLVG